MSITFSSLHNGFPINTNLQKGLGCLTAILDNHLGKLGYMIAKHSKVMQVRFDLHYPKDGSVLPSPQHIYDFNYNFKRKLQREKISGGHKVDPQIIWVEEQHTSPHPHYHYLLLVNGNAKRDYHAIVREALRIWKQTLGTENSGVVNFCDDKEQNGLMVERGSPYFQLQLGQCTYQGSYIAKISSKAHRRKGSWLSGGTHLPALAPSLDLF